MSPADRGAEGSPGPDVDTALERLRADLARDIHVPPFEGVLRRHRRRVRRRIAGAAVSVAAVAAVGALLLPQLAAPPARHPAVLAGSPLPTVTETVTVSPSPQPSAGVAVGPAPVPATVDAAARVSDVSFTDGENGVALGRRCADPSCDALAFLSQDGGLSYQQAYAIPTTAGNLGKVATIAGTELVYAYDPGLAVSTDGGRSWSVLPTPAGNAVADVSVRAGQLTALVTRAGGASLVTGAAGSTQFPTADPVAVPGGDATARLQRPVAGLDVVTLGTTTPRLEVYAHGAWSAPALPAGCRAEPSVSTVSVTSWFLACVGAAGDEAVWSSDDGGASWSMLAADVVGVTDATITVFDAQSASLSQPTGALFQSADGGRSWAGVTAPGGAGLGQPHLLRSGGQTLGWAVLRGTGRVWYYGTSGWQPAQAVVGVRP